MPKKSTTARPSTSSTRCMRRTRTESRQCSTSSTCPTSSAAMPTYSSPVVAWSRRSSRETSNGLRGAGLWHITLRRVQRRTPRPVDTTPGVFDDGSHQGFDVWGLYGRRVITLLRQGVGAYDAEAMLQAGRFSSGDIRAWRFVIEGSHLLADAAWSPRLGLVLDVASGDQNPADPNLETFNALFQGGTYSGRAQLLGPSNSIRFEPTATFAPARQVRVSAGWGFYWRQSVYDALYSISGQVIVPSNGVTDRYEG